MTQLDIPAPYLIRYLPLTNKDMQQTALFYASVNITDIQGRNATQLNLDPPTEGQYLYLAWLSDEL